jgi:hypothetical protein
MTTDGKEVTPVGRIDTLSRKRRELLKERKRERRKRKFFNFVKGKRQGQIARLVRSLSFVTQASSLATATES